MDFIIISTILLLSFGNFGQCTTEKDLDLKPSETIVWGPGLNPENVVLRARYIFLQLINSEGKKYV